MQSWRTSLELPGSVGVVAGVSRQEPHRLQHARQNLIATGEPRIVFERAHGRLQRPARLVNLVGGGGIQQHNPTQCFGQEVGLAMYHEGAVAMADFEQPDRAERHERFSQRRTANVQVAGEVAFGRQALAELESAIDDAGDQARGNVVGQPRAVYRTKRRALGRALVVGHRRTAARLRHTQPPSIREPLARQRSDQSGVS